MSMSKKGFLGCNLKDAVGGGATEINWKSGKSKMAAKRPGLVTPNFSMGHNSKIIFPSMGFSYHGISEK